MKYVVTDRGDFVIGTSLTSHRDLARGLYGEPVGAGFIRFKRYFDDPSIECYGKSVSLGLESREQDAGIISMILNQ